LYSIRASNGYEFTKKIWIIFPLVKKYKIYKRLITF
jgi:hypothetical protein